VNPIAFPKTLLSSLVAAALLSGVAATSPRAAEGVDEQLKEVERAIKAGRKTDKALKRKARNLGDQLRLTRRQSVAIARSIQENESEVSRLEADLARLEQGELEKTKALGHSREQFSQVLMALQKIARNPPEAMIVQPLTPSQMVRSAILLRAAVPEIEQRAGHLRRGLLLLAQTRREMDERRGQLAAVTGTLKEQRSRLAALMKDKQTLYRRAVARSTEAEGRVKALARKAGDMRELLRRLESDRLAREKAAREKAEREKAARRKAASEMAAREKSGASKPAPQTAAVVEPAPESAPPPISQARGTLPFPVAGRVVGLYGQAMDTGMTRKGILIRTRRSAQVVAPHGGRVMFAGPFRGYGHLLIIEHGEGYHSLLAGLGRIDATLGQSVVAGEPIGLMGSASGNALELYVEFRRKGQPINPLPWLAAKKGKVSG
jgi:septal ring factor EnvC (AmiA/AmiB activator)